MMSSRGLSLREIVAGYGKNTPYTPVDLLCPKCGAQRTSTDEPCPNCGYWEAVATVRELVAAAEKVQVRRKDTGRLVSIKPETYKEKKDEYESPKKTKRKEPAKPTSSKAVDNILSAVKHPDAWRKGEDEVDLEKTPEEFEKGHVGFSPKGSAIIGTPHADEEAPEAHKDYFKKRVIPKALDTAKKAIKAGKKVTFLAEDTAWWNKEPDALDKNYPGESEQYQMAAALHKKFGKKISHDSWDDEEVTLDKPDSKAWSKLYKIAGDKTKAHASMAAAMLGQGESVESVKKKGILTADAEKHLKKMGMDVSKIDKKGTREKMYDLAFPMDKGKPHNEYSAVMSSYNDLRQQNMLNKVKKIESEGGVALVTPGASHAWNLAPVFKGGLGSEEKKATVSKMTREAFAVKTFKLKRSQLKKFSYFLHQLQIGLQNAIKSLYKITHTDTTHIMNNLIKTHASVVKLIIKVDKHLHGVP